MWRSWLGSYPWRCHSHLGGVERRLGLERGEALVLELLVILALIWLGVACDLTSWVNPRINFVHHLFSSPNLISPFSIWFFSSFLFEILVVSLNLRFLGSFELDQNVQGHLRINPTKWFGQIQLEHENPLFWGILIKPHPSWWILRLLEIYWVLGVDALKISSQHSQEHPCKVSSRSDLISGFESIFPEICSYILDISGMNFGHVR